MVEPLHQQSHDNRLTRRVAGVVTLARQFVCNPPQCRAGAFALLPFSKKWSA